MTDEKNWEPLGDMDMEAAAAAGDVPLEAEIVDLPTRADIDEPAVVAEQTSETLARLMSMSDLAIFLPQSIDEAKRCISDTMNDIAVKSAAMGFYLIYIKEQVSHGDYGEYLDGIGVSSQRASEYTNIAHMLMALPQSERKLLFKQGKSKLIELSKVTPEVAAEAKNTGALDDIDLMTIKDLRSALRKAKGDIEKRDNAIVDLEQKQAAANARPNTWPEPVLHVREEATLAGLAIQQQADELAALVNQLEKPEFVGALSNDSKQASIESDAAIGIVQQTLAGALVRLHELLADLDARGVKRFGLQDLVPELDDDELRRVGDMWNPQKQIADREKKQREIDRTNKARRGKRGRPKGSKAKA